MSKFFGQFLPDFIAPPYDVIVVACPEYPAFGSEAGIRQFAFLLTAMGRSGTRVYLEEQTGNVVPTEKVLSIFEAKGMSAIAHLDPFLLGFAPVPGGNLYEFTIH